MKAWLAVFVLAASLAVAASLAAGPAGQGGQAGTISGRVFTRDGIPAAGVRVSAIEVGNSLVPAGQTLASLTETDRDGRYRLEQAPPGRYLIMAGPLDLPTYFPGVNAESAAEVVTVAAAANLTGVNFSLTIVPGLRFSGKVVRQDNAGNTVAAPVAATPSSQNLQIRLQSRSSSTTASTVVGADGSFDFPRLRPGTYQILVTPSPRMPQLSVTLLDNDITGYELVVPLMVQVAGTVTVEDGGPTPRFPIVFSSVNDLPPSQALSASNVQQNVSVQSAPRFIVQVPAGANRVRVGDVVAGAVDVQRIPNGFTVKKIIAGGVDLTANPLVVTPAGAPPIQIVLGAASVPWVRVTGRVNGRTVPNGYTFNVLFTQTLASPLQVISYLDGSFEIPKALPGEYRAGGAPTSPAFIVPDVPSEVAGLVLDVVGADSASGPAKPISQPASAARVSGRIIGHAKAALGAQVRIENAATGEVRSTPIYADGSFEFQQAQPGDYLAEVVPTIPGAQPSRLTVAARDIGDVQVIVPATRDIAGTVEIEGAGRLPRTLSFTVASTRVVADVRPDGTFAVTLPDGFPVELIPDTLPQGYALANPLRLSGAETELRVVLKTSGAAAISGRISGDIAALGDSHVWLTDNAGRQSALETAVGQDGTFAFSNVVEGAYTVSLATTGIPATASSIRVDVLTGRSVTDVNLTAPRIVHGRVTVDGGALPQRFGLRLTGGAGPVTIGIEPQRDGSFSALLPTGERTIGPAAGLPADLQMLTVTYGATDLLTHPLQIPDAGALEELTIRLGPASR
jgi:hypothetical protein